MSFIFSSPSSNTIKIEIVPIIEPSILPKNACIPAKLPSFDDIFCESI